MPKWLQRLLAVLLSWWLLALFLEPFATINPIAHPRALIVYILMMSLIDFLAVLLPRQWPWWLLLGCGTTIGGLWGVLPLKQPFGVSWFTAYLHTFTSATGKFVQAGGVDVPTVLSMTLVITLVAFLLLLTVVVRFYPGAIAIVLSYLVAVHIFNGSELTIQFIQLALVTGLMAMLHLYADHWRPFLLGCVFISGLTLGLAWLSSATPLNDQLANVSIPFRDRLNQRGFYAGIETYINGPGRTGFTENSRVLGGPVYDDPTPVFTATSAKASYYRVAVDAEYTGTGWQAGADQNQSMPLDGATMRDSAATIDYGPATSTALTFNGGKTYLPLPYGQLTFTGGQPDPTTDFLLNPETRRMQTTDQARFQRLDIQVQPKQISAAQLAAATSSRQKVASRYLQLPRTLPKRIRTLAKRITAKATTPYEKVLAVQNYLKSDPRFTYSKTDARRTPPTRDYVDYFLFDSPIGYCDNFSSAMVVLCRSIGLPARWAKGFNTGTLLGGSGNQKRYVIRNSNAHSWPEVYFDNLGWLPFEPTPGFSDPATPDENVSPPSPSSSGTESVQPSSTSNSSSSSSRVSASTVSKQTKRQSRPSLNRLSWLKKSLFIILLALLLIIVWQLPALVMLILGIGLGATNFSARYRILLRALRWVKKRPVNQSLDDYAQAIDKRLGQQAYMFNLTKAYEETVFGNLPVNTAILRPHWKALTKQLVHDRYWWQRSKKHKS